MPAWALSLLIRYGVPLALQILIKSGAVNEAESLLIKGYVAAKDLQTYPGFPQGKNGQ